MSSMSERCLQFRLQHFAPSGGWLASLVLPIALATGLYDYTLLGFVFIFVAKIMLSSSCEAAMVLGLGFDFTIPCQYHNSGVHMAQLQEYWPKMILATSVEMACYVLVEPDLFNYIVLIKTLFTFSYWMKIPKQWPLVYPEGRKPKSRQKSSRPRDDSTRSQRPEEARTSSRSSKRNGETAEERARRKAGEGGDGGRAAGGQTAPTSQPAGGTSNNSAPQAQTTAQSTPAPSSGQTAAQPQGSKPNGSNASDPKKKKLSKEELERLDKFMGGLSIGGKPLDSATKKDFQRVLRLPIGDPEFQVLARQWNGMENSTANMPILEWERPPEAEIQSVIDRCKAVAPGESEEDHKKIASDDNIKRVKEVLAKGPYEDPDWKWLQGYCKVKRRIECPEWLIPLPTFVRGWWIPYEKQTEIIKQIVASEKCPNDKVRGLCDAVEIYFNDKAVYEKTIAEINETAGLALKPFEIAEESDYMPNFLNVQDAPKGQILVSACHWKEAQYNLRVREAHTAMQDMENFDAAVKNLPASVRAGDKRRASYCQKALSPEYSLENYGRRTEHYTDYHGGRLNLPFDYLNKLRDRWQSYPYHGAMALETADTILYAVKMSSDQAKAEDVVKKCDEAIAAGGNAWANFYKLYEHLSPSEREGNHLFEKCRALGDEFLGDGGGAPTSRVRLQNPKYQ